MKVVVIDYGISNLGSIRQALAECGGEAFIADNPEELLTATHIILPGVGAFKDGMGNLKKFGWLEALKKAVLKDKVPLLGICLGMQLLADNGEEGGSTEGLGFVPGEVKRFISINPEEKVPHVGWNEVYPKGDNPLFSGILPGIDFYFVHSYHFIPKHQENIMSTTPYCGEFVSGVMKDNVYGTQFHPEKSSRAGFQLLKNFLNL